MQTDALQPQPLVKSSFKSLFKTRPIESNKGSFGSVGIIGGDAGMVGAMVLASRAALFCGAGKVFAASISDAPPSVDFLHPEVMYRTPSNLIELMPSLSCVVIGPGLGQSAKAIEALEFWIAQNVVLLLDADALNLIAKNTQLQAQVMNRTAETIITPHPGEASRLLNAQVDHIQQNRTESALQLAQKLQSICVLKGAGTICANPDGDCFINTTGNPGLASAGTGDVLSGIIASLVAQGLTCIEAAKMGVFVHGAAADALVARGIGPAGLTASEVAHEARSIINQLV
jgi:ADP-dependent NAD(P)H-hydrate dehydratase / NAD(P)H-hydrate epimerase